MIQLDTFVLYTGIIILINAILLSYTLKLERVNCHCSNKWMRDYIKYYSGSLIIVSIILLTLSIFIKKRRIPTNRYLSSLIRIIVLLATLVQVYSVFKYSQDMKCKINECKCSDDWRGRFMYWLGIFGFVIYTLLLLGFVLCMFVKGPVSCLFS